MTRRRKLLFALVTLLGLLGIAECVAQVVWWRLGTDAFATTERRGAAMLRNDAINFMKEPHGVLGYVLKPDFERGSTHINRDGFAQYDVVPRERVPGALRIVAMGESTTMGHNTKTGNYPAHLMRILERQMSGAKVEMLNAGVAGWVSDQVALWAEEKVAAYRPDILILYVGWNDFQSYDPYAPEPERSYFEQTYGPLPEGRVKTVVLLSALYGVAMRRMLTKPASGGAGWLPTTAPNATYRFTFASLDRIIAAFREHQPEVRIAVSTLVGRWPDGDISEDQGRTWWMKRHGISPVAAAATLQRLNRLIVAYAASKNLMLIDAASELDAVDRGKLQWDFAHMHDDGYELLAEIFFEHLRRAGWAEGGESPRRDELFLAFGQEPAQRVGVP